MSESFRSIRPKSDEHIAYYSTYIDRVPDGDIVATLESQLGETLKFLRSIPESKLDYRYAPGKWNIKEIVGHLGDGERVFQYRAWRFSRADTTPVPGFEENDYVANAPFSRMNVNDLISEFEHLRRRVFECSPEWMLMQCKDAALPMTPKYLCEQSHGSWRGTSIITRKSCALVISRTAHEPPRVCSQSRSYSSRVWDPS